MKSFAAILALATSAAAFAPAQQASTSSALSAKAFSDALGAQAPVSPPFPCCFKLFECCLLFCHINFYMSYIMQFLTQLFSLPFL